ncbi:ATP-binding cassette domain-containing protein [Lachnospiraceae bacterium WCA-9-b2]|uniref:ATP-binding cassette domain-containing protein n=1 Tax=Sporofaciens musculi TaxID=2681861 RepID=A0A7X3MGR0_9FIRM|nr:ABC transporter ATP-binding protein [Sporofaciens musculi]MXP76042.1 ATP-binding cassette domain-containing protein [Sporofaciens musculi]
MRYMKEVLRNNKIWIVVYLFIGLFNAFMANYKADYFQKIVDGLTDRTITVYGILFYGAVLFVDYGMNYLDEYPSAKLGNEIYLDFKLLALRTIGRMDYSEYQTLGTGKLVQQIENGANAGKNVLYDFWFCVARNLLPTILFSLYFIWKIDRTITYFLFAGYIVVFLVTNLLLNGLYQIKEKILTGEEELNHFLVRGFMEMPVFRMKHQFPNEVKKALEAKRVIVSSKVKMTMIHEAFFTIFALLVACLDIGILTYVWKNNHLSIGSVVALITLIDNAYTPIAIFNVIYVQYKLNKTAWLRFTGLLDLKEDTQLEQGMDFAEPLNEIRIEDVSFSYGSKEVLKCVNLTIKGGEKIAFVGESGSGKSTLIKILLGLLKYNDGNILFDDKPLKDISLESLYEKVSYLSQDTPVFDGTIKENLVFDNEASEADIHVSLEKTQLLSMLATLDKGVETRIGEKGTCLSGGEKQRLALARLWFDNPDIVVLDEATSALDNVTEGIVMKNVLEQINHATVIAVAHRLSSIREFDRIVIFRNGKIVGSGTFEELLESNSYFFELYRKEKENSNSMVM